MEEFIKIVVLGLVGMIFALLIGDKSPIFATCIVIITSICMFMISFSLLTELIEQITIIAEKSGLDTSIFSPVLKVCAISIIVKISSELCKDAGYSAIASKIQFAGSIISIIVIFPIFTRIINIIQGILE